MQKLPIGGMEASGSAAGDAGSTPTTPTAPAVIGAGERSGAVGAGVAAVATTISTAPASSAALAVSGRRGSGGGPLSISPARTLSGELREHLDQYLGGLSDTEQDEDEDGSDNDNEHSDHDLADNINSLNGSGEASADADGGRSSASSGLSNLSNLSSIGARYGLSLGSGSANSLFRGGSGSGSGSASGYESPRSALQRQQQLRNNLTPSKQPLPHHDVPQNNNNNNINSSSSNINSSSQPYRGGEAGASHSGAAARWTVTPATPPTIPRMGGAASHLLANTVPRLAVFPSSSSAFAPRPTSAHSAASAFSSSSSFGGGSSFGDSLAFPSASTATPTTSSPLPCLFCIWQSSHSSPLPPTLSHPPLPPSLSHRLVSTAAHQSGQ